MNFNIIGAGRLGRSIANALIQHRLATLETLLTTKMAHSQQCCDELQAGRPVDSLDKLAFADITFITTPDDAIEAVVDMLAKTGNLQPGSIVIHCSGVLSSKILEPLHQQRCHIASLHPLRAFGSQRVNQAIFNRCPCVIEGDSKALACLIPLFESLGANLVTIKAESKIKYHAAAVMASNYLVTLASLATQLMEEAGLSQPDAKHMVTSLMQSNLDNICERDTASDALTGPLSRGDLMTVKKHLDILPAGAVADFYRSAGLATVGISSHDDEMRRLLKNLLSD